MGDYVGLWVGFIAVLGALVWAGIYYTAIRISRLSSRLAQLTKENAALLRRVESLTFDIEHLRKRFRDAEAALRRRGLS